MPLLTMIRRTRSRAWKSFALGWLGLAFAPPAPAVTISGSDWIVCYNLPAQSEELPQPEEFAIRDLLIRQIKQLRRGDEATLAVFTFSGGSRKTGFAGPLLETVHKSLGRGARIEFIIDSGINTAQTFLWGLSLSNLAARPYKPLALVVSPEAALMHHKTALFNYGGSNLWVFTSSGNFTGAAGTKQWNIALLLRNVDLYAAFETEMNEFRSGRFGQDKQRAHDGTRFRLEEAWGDCWVRFGPYPDQPGQPDDTAESDIRRLIQSAQEEIYFAMHRFHRPSLSRALVAAANRGVRVVGVIPESDRGKSRNSISGPTVKYFLNPANYSGTNRVQLLPALAAAHEARWDSGEQDLVHLKYAIIDPDGQHPIVIHGAANWSAYGLADLEEGNDESILFLRHRGIAHAFREQFRRMTTIPNSPHIEPVASQEDTDNSSGESASDIRAYEIDISLPVP